MDASKILKQLACAGDAFKENEPGSREELIAQSRALIAALELPSEFILQTLWAEPARSAIIRLAVDVHLFQHIKEAAPAGLSLEALSQKTGVELDLLTRLIRHLVAVNVLVFHPDGIHGTALSDSLADERYQHTILCCYDVVWRTLESMPAYFKNNAYRSPTPGGTDGPFHQAYGTNLGLFDWIIATPSQLQNFDALMKTYRAGKVNWFAEGFYPVSQRLVCGFDLKIGDAFLVDVGGGEGNDVAALVATFKSLPGRVVVQDREPVIANVLNGTEEMAFEVQSHDFFTRQPVKGARAYFLHSILHDWSDNDGVRILENLVPALVKGYSRVLLYEIVVSEEKPTLAATTMDLVMMSHFGTRERTEMGWRQILGRVGLKVVGIYTYPGVAESLIEAELA
ncbi:Winged helix-turn-helix transcription repressor DNA-binding [Penicillium coprophilum]|uniref:Winged helix-turn-helix transcription repressor DNA-binding n=1 Tax=Penicillium coprophilum TaxID=36646 RepID=UPI00239F3C2B|nr:Winged helix-turn-helix transcription repressor DNA-binding [Penicillium coprophilum]KAJ5162628.1 Winged helix-turn-helix transcription repressor DNA-binding [Penicillium coprophilum]